VNTHRAYTTRHFGCTAEESVRHIGSAAEVSGHFGSIPLLPKCLAAEMSYCRSVRTPCLHPLLHPVNSNSSGLRSSEHHFELPVCHINLHRKSFIARCLYRFKEIICFLHTLCVYQACFVTFLCLLYLFYYM